MRIRAVHCGGRRALLSPTYTEIHETVLLMQAIVGKYRKLRTLEVQSEPPTRHRGRSSGKRVRRRLRFPCAGSIARARLREIRRFPLPRIPSRSTRLRDRSPGPLLPRADLAELFAEAKLMLVRKTSRANRLCMN